MPSQTLDYFLIASGLLDIALATIALIICGRAHAQNNMRFGKYVLMLAMALYIALESNSLTRGLYHSNSILSLLWNVLDALWMIGAIWALSYGVGSMISAAKRLSELSERVNRILDIYESK